MAKIVEELTDLEVLPPGQTAEELAILDGSRNQVEQLFPFTVTRENGVEIMISQEGEDCENLKLTIKDEKGYTWINIEIYSGTTQIVREASRNGSLNEWVEKTIPTCRRLETGGLVAILLSPDSQEAFFCFCLAYGRACFFKAEKLGYDFADFADVKTCQDILENLDMVSKKFADGSEAVVVSHLEGVGFLMMETNENCVQFRLSDEDSRNPKRAIDRAVPACYMLADGGSAKIIFDPKLDPILRITEFNGHYQDIVLVDWNQHENLDETQMLRIIQAMIPFSKRLDDGSTLKLIRAKTSPHFSLAMPDGRLAEVEAISGDVKEVIRHLSTFKTAREFLRRTSKVKVSTLKRVDSDQLNHEDALPRLPIYKELIDGYLLEICDDIHLTLKIIDNNTGEIYFEENIENFVANSMESETALPIERDVWIRFLIKYIQTLEDSRILFEENESYVLDLLNRTLKEGDYLFEAHRKAREEKSEPYDQVLIEWLMGQRTLCMCVSNQCDRFYRIFPVTNEYVESIEEKGGLRINTEQARCLMANSLCINTSEISTMIDRFERTN